MTVYFIGDTHFDHDGSIDDKGAIERFSRPFDDVEEMNDELEDRWNSTVGPKDSVVFLGDLAYVSTSNKLEEWYWRLNNLEVFIAGNHEEDIIGKSEFSRSDLPLEASGSFSYGGYKFCCVHKPAHASDWGEWVIHGHHHDIHPDRHPFIDPLKKRVNVSVERIKYRPVSIDRIVELIESGETHRYLRDR